MPTLLVNVRYWEESGHRADLSRRLQMTQSGHSSLAAWP